MAAKSRRRRKGPRQNRADPIIDLCASDDSPGAVLPTHGFQQGNLAITTGTEDPKVEKKRVDSTPIDRSPLNIDVNANPFSYLTDEKKKALRKLSITESDMQRLNPDGWLNDVIINFYIDHLEKNVLETGYDKHRLHFFNSFFFSKLIQLDKEIRGLVKSKCKDSTGKRLELCLRWTKNTNIFEKDYVFFPVFDDGHWSLCILCFPRESGQANSRAAILHFDSYSPGHDSETVFRSLRRFLNTTLKHSEKSNKSSSVCVIPNTNEFSAKDIPGHRLKVPQQNNLVDCGCFLLCYLELFLANIPECLNSEYLDEKFGVDWFNPCEPAKLRLIIKKLMLSKIGVHLPLEITVNLTGYKRKIHKVFHTQQNILPSNKRRMIDTNSPIEHESHEKTSQEKVFDPSNMGASSNVVKGNESEIVLEAGDHSMDTMKKPTPNECISRKLLAKEYDKSTLSLGCMIDGMISDSKSKKLQGSIATTEDSINMESHMNPCNMNFQSVSEGTIENDGMVIDVDENLKFTLSSDSIFTPRVESMNAVEEKMRMEEEKMRMEDEYADIPKNLNVDLLEKDTKKVTVDSDGLSMASTDNLFIGDLISEISIIPHKDVVLCDGIISEKKFLFNATANLNNLNTVDGVIQKGYSKRYMFSLPVKKRPSFRNVNSSTLTNDPSFLGNANVNNVQTEVEEKRNVTEIEIVNHSVSNVIVYKRKKFRKFDSMNDNNSLLVESKTTNPKELLMNAEMMNVDEPNISLVNSFESRKRKKTSKF